MPSGDEILNGLKKIFTLDFKSEFNYLEKGLLRLAGGLLLLVVLYSGGIIGLTNAIDEKTAEAQDVIDDTNTKIQAIQEDKKTVQSRTSIYTTRISNLESYDEELASELRNKKAIPTLLNQIMSVIPKNVQITSIENTTDDNIIINAQRTIPRFRILQSSFTNKWNTNECKF